MRIFFTLMAIFLSALMPSVYAQDQKTLDPSKFSFSYYWSAESMQKDLRAMFPPGTPIKEVDKILIEKEGASSKIELCNHSLGGCDLKPSRVKTKRYSKETILRRTHSFFTIGAHAWVVAVPLDENNKLVALNVY